jgi:hypothetical protein
VCPTGRPRTRPIQKRRAAGSNGGGSYARRGVVPLGSCSRRAIITVQPGNSGDCSSSRNVGRFGYDIRPASLAVGANCLRGCCSLRGPTEVRRVAVREREAFLNGNVDQAGAGRSVDVSRCAPAERSRRDLRLAMAASIAFWSIGSGWRLNARRFQ